LAPLKAAEKIRDYFIGKVYQARKPLSDPQVFINASPHFSGVRSETGSNCPLASSFSPQMPQNALLKRQACFEFLLRHSRQTANEIKDEYVDTMSKVHTTYFKTYLHRLLKLQVRGSRRGRPSGRRTVSLPV